MSYASRGNDDHCNGNDNDNNSQDCVICLMPLLSLSSSSSSSSSSPEPIGACTPCGHLLHVSCHQQMTQFTGRSSSLKCPTCNVKTKSFCRIYLDLDCLQLQANKNNQDDDEASLDEEEQDDDDNDNEKLTVEDDDDENCDSSNKADLCEDTTAISNSNNNNNIDSNTGPEIIVLDDDDNDDDPHDNSRKQSPTHATNTIIQEKAQKYKRLTLKYRKQYQGGQARQLEQLKRNQELQNELDKLKQHSREQQKSLLGYETQVEAHELEMQGYRLDLHTAKRQVLELQHQLELSQQACRRAEQTQQEQQAALEKKLHQHAATSMIEFRGMLQKYPVVVQEKKQLQNQVEKLKQRLKVLEKEPNNATKSKPRENHEQPQAPKLPKRSSSYKQNHHKFSRKRTVQELQAMAAPAWDAVFQSPQHMNKRPLQRRVSQPPEEIVVTKRSVQAVRMAQAVAAKSRADPFAAFGPPPKKNNT